jgi:hypothetical protein
VVRREGAQGGVTDSLAVERVARAHPETDSLPFCGAKLGGCQVDGDGHVLGTVPPGRAPLHEPVVSNLVGHVLEVDGA